MCYIPEHVFDRYNKWLLVMAIFAKELESFDMFNYRSVCSIQQCKVTDTLLYLFMY